MITSQSNRKNIVMRQLDKNCGATLVPPDLASTSSAIRIRNGAGSLCRFDP